MYDPMLAAMQQGFTDDPHGQPTDGGGGDDEGGDILSPGFGFDFEEVTSVFEEAASEMDPETVLFMEGFTLQDAMSAFEIGEPRLDTGFIPHGTPSKPPFNPLQPLTPEEVCWVLDKTIGLEMEWHAGAQLPHTIFTLEYVHCLGDIEPEMISWKLIADAGASDPQRPLELVSVVLGACVQGTLKCLDLAWKEMHANDSIQDTEDWQSEKCEVSVLENLPAKYILNRLEDAANWVDFSDIVEPKWKQPLIARILLRQTLLDLYTVSPSRNRLQYQALLAQVRSLLHDISVPSAPVPSVSSESPVHLVFDPYLSRRLSTCVPIRVIPMKENAEIWEMFDRFLGGLAEMCGLVGSGRLVTWEDVGKLRSWTNIQPREAYVRSKTQTAFFNGVLVLDQHTFSWTLDRFFEERLGSSWSALREAAVSHPWSLNPSSSSSRIPSAAVAEALGMPTTLGLATPQAILSQLERRLYKLVVQHVKLSWMNPPRRRRRMMKAVVEWHMVYDLALDLVAGLGDETPANHPLRLLPTLLTTIRLECIRDIVFSGFTLELYAAYERPFAYWYLSVVGSMLDECWRGPLEGVLLVAASRGEGAGGVGGAEEAQRPWREVHWKRRWMAGLGEVCKAFLLLTLPSLSTALVFNSDLPPSAQPSYSIRDLATSASSTAANSSSSLPADVPASPSSSSSQSRSVSATSSFEAYIEALEPNFQKRYKWAFRPDYERTKAPPVADPDLFEFLEFCREVVDHDINAEASALTSEAVDPRYHLNRAREIFEDMLEVKEAGPWLQGVPVWAEVSVQFIQNLHKVCTAALAVDELPTSLGQLDAFNAKYRLKWEPYKEGAHLWFPEIVPK